jgi:hypothetical protein
MLVASFGVWQWCAGIALYHQMIYSKSLEGDSGEGTPRGGLAPTSVITIEIMLDYLLSQGCLPHVHHAFNQLIPGVTLVFLILNACFLFCRSLWLDFVFSVSKYSFLFCTTKISF